MGSTVCPTASTPTTARRSLAASRFPRAISATAASISAIRGTAALPLGVWSHVAVTYDGARQRIYVNGVEVANRAQTGAIDDQRSPLRIGGNGAFSGGEFFRGLIDEVRVYNRALTAARSRRRRGHVGVLRSTRRLSAVGCQLFEDC